MNINDYLISQPGQDWGALLSEWIPPLPANFTLWLVNRFGDLFVVTENNAVQWLDLDTGSVVEVARSREQFAQLLDVSGNAEKWLRILLVDACRNAGMHLGSGQCYGLKIPPSLGGKYEVANVTPKNLGDHFSFMSYMHKQTNVYWVPEN